jgi:hypothetical protein
MNERDRIQNVFDNTKVTKDFLENVARGIIHQEYFVDKMLSKEDASKIENKPFDATYYRAQQRKYHVNTHRF